MSIQKSYDKWAESYDSNHNRTRDMDQLATQEMLGKYAYTSVLELGCGTGKNTWWFLDQGAEVLGVDFSEEMLRKAREKIDHSGVKFSQMDMNKNWSVPANSFDLVTVNLVLEHIENLDHIFEQAEHCMMPGSHMFVSELHPFKQYGGSKARFESNGEVEFLDTYVHHLTDYINSAGRHGLQLTELREWFDPDPGSVPRLITMVFAKSEMK